MAIQVNNINFEYSTNKKVLTDISFALSNGESLAIVGASGCGKSTLLRIISGILPCTNNDPLHPAVTIDGMTPTEYIKTGKLSFMFQEATLMPNLSIFDNIALPLKVKGIKDDKRVNDLIESVGLTEFKNYLPKNLSGGMKTRVALARSFVTQPELLLLDEPFSALDIAWKSKLYVELEKLRKQFNTTLLIVTHDIQEALLLSNKVIVLNKKGYILATEKVDYLEPKIYDISKFTNSTQFQTTFSSIQKWIIDDGVRNISNRLEIDKILNKIESVAGSDNEIWDTIDTDIISLRKFSNNADVNEKLYQSFIKSNNPELKIQLIWDILEFTDVSDEKQKEILIFCINNLDVFTKHELKYYNVDSSRIFDLITETRIKDYKYPESKRWIYLLDLFVSSETERVKEFIDQIENGEIKNLNYPMAKLAAKKLKEKMTVTV